MQALVANLGSEGLRTGFLTAEPVRRVLVGTTPNPPIFPPSGSITHW